MFIRITTLVENSCGEHLGLVCEHGLSFLIEKDGRSYLFDTGQSDSILRNARPLALDLFAAKKIILSHGHYDHSGGLPALLRAASPSYQPEIYVHKDFFFQKYSLQNNRSEFLGNSFTPDDITRQGCALHYVESNLLQIGDGIWIVGSFNKSHPEEIVNERFQLLKNGRLEPDPFTDEIMIVVESPKGLVLLMGCAHPGMMNMIETVRHRMNKKVYALLGGTHLVEADEAHLRAATQYLLELDCMVIGVSHCTGNAMMSTLRNTDSRFYNNRTGSSLIIS